MSSIIDANVVLKMMGDTFLFDHPSNTASWDLHVILAQNYYNAQFICKAYDEVKILDSTVVLDCTRAADLDDLLFEIERLRGGG